MATGTQNKHYKGRAFLRDRFINGLLKRGNKSLAERIFDDVIDELGTQSGKNGVEIFEKAVDNVKPLLEVKSRRIGGATYQVPIEIKTDRQLTLALRWILDFARARNDKTISKRIASELMDAFRKEGSSMKKKADTHKMAEANRAFAHYRW